MAIVFGTLHGRSRRRADSQGECAINEIAIHPSAPDAGEDVGARRGTLAAPVRWLLLLGVGAALLLGGPVLRFIAVATGLFALLGEWDGAIRHVFRWAALGLLFVVVPLAAGPLGDQLSTHTTMAPAAGRIIGGILSVVLTLVIVGWLGGRLARACHRRPAARDCDRVVGLLLGGGEGALAAIACVWVLAMFAAPLARVQERRAAQPDIAAAPWLETFEHAAALVRTDPAGAYLAANNPLPHAPMFESASQMANVLADPVKFSQVMKASELREFGEMPVIKAHIQKFRDDPELRRAAEERDIGALLSSRAFMDMLSDPQVHAALQERFGDLQRAVAEADARKSR